MVNLTRSTCTYINNIFTLKLFGPISYQILRTLLNDCHSISTCIIMAMADFPIKTYLSGKKWCTKFVYKKKTLKKVSRPSPQIKIRPWRRGGYDCYTTLTSLYIKGNNVLAYQKSNMCIFCSLLFLQFALFTIYTLHADWINTIIPGTKPNGFLF